MGGFLGTTEHQRVDDGCGQDRDEERQEPRAPAGDEDPDQDVDEDQQADRDRDLLAAALVEDALRTAPLLGQLAGDGGDPGGATLLALGLGGPGGGQDRGLPLALLATALALLAHRRPSTQLASRAAPASPDFS